MSIASSPSGEQLALLLKRRRTLRRDLLETNEPDNVACPTELKDALRHNGYPSEVALQLAQGNRNQFESNLLKAEVRLLQIEGTVNLQHEKDRIIQHVSPTWVKIRVCDIVLSVFRRLPVEILQEISIHATPSQPSVVTDQAPVSLAHVCRIWRKAVLGLPALWKELYLEIDMQIPNDWAMQKYQNMVRNWYQRAGSNELSLHIYTPSGTREIEASRKVFNKFFLDSLRPIFLRIQHLSIGAPRVAYFLPLFADAAPPRFKTLIVKNIHRDKGPSPPPTQKYNPLFKRVDHLILDQPFVFKGFARRAFPWFWLSKLAVSQSLGVKQYLDILGACPYLDTAYFTLTNSQLPDYDATIYNSNIHFYMKHITILFSDKLLPLSNVFPYHQFMDLTTLEIGHVGEFVAKDGLGSGFYKRTVERISLTGDWSESGVVIIELLHNAAKLIDLHFSIETDTRPILRILTSLSPPQDVQMPSEPQPFLPRLSTLSIVIPPIDELDLESRIPDIVSALTGLLNARASDLAPPDQRLKTLRISTSHTELLAEMQRVVEPFGTLGLQFEVTSNDITPDWCQKPVDTGLHKWQDGIDERLEKRKHARKLVPAYPAPPQSFEYTSYLVNLD